MDKTEKKLKDIERHLSFMYRKALKSIGKDWKSYMMDVSKEIADLQEKYDEAKAGGDKEEIKKTGKALSQVKREKTLMNKRYKELTEDTARQLYDINRIANDYVNNRLPEIYAMNYNALKSDVEDIKGYSFSLVDASTVKNLAMSDKTLLPYKVLDEKKDVRWNIRKINNAVLQGILAGDAIPDIANRLQHVTGMNENAAIRNARTAVTSAQNKGRFDSFEKAAEDGMILEKEWLSSDGVRTRDSHKNMPIGVGGEVVAWDEPFSNGLMYPGDPDGEPAEVYNCRCRMKAKILGFKKVKK